MASGDVIRTQASLLEPTADWQNFAAIMQYSWDVVRTENGGAPNVHGTADRLYDGLLASSACALGPSWTMLPDREQFICSVRRVMVEPEIFRKALYPGATEAVGAMGGNGPVLFWTAGDMRGRRDANGRVLPGSMEQYRRVMGSGLINDAADRIRQDGGQPNKFGFAGAEDKFALLSGCFEWLAENNTVNVVVLEDKLPNLLGVQRHVSEIGASANLHLVWIRQGRHGATLEEAPAGMHSLNNIADFPALLASLDVDRPGFLVDYDGVVSNDERRAYLQQLSVWNMLCEQGWVQGMPFEAEN